MKHPAGRLLILCGLVCGLAAISVSTPAGPPARPPQFAFPYPVDLSGYAVPDKASHPKIDAGLRLNLHGGGRENPAGASLRAVIEAAEPGRRGPDQPRMAHLVSLIEACGGIVEVQSGLGIQALLPPPAVEILAGNPAVSRIRSPLAPVPAAVQSEGVPRSGAASWTSLASYRAPDDPVKIAVLDLGFQGYLSRLGTELPSEVTVSSFRFDGDISAGTAHGTACAEIIFDMAPEAKIYLVNFATDIEQHAAVEYLISEKVDIISASLTWPGAGAGNGTGPICGDVVKCAEKGILWVGAAGDDAENHWEGLFSDSNGDLFQNFSGSDEILQWAVPANTWTRATLSWNDWGTWTGSSYGSPSQDYDLLLWRWNGTAWELLEYCDDWQDGTAGQKPVEQSSLWRINVATYYGISILKFGATVNNSLEVFVQGNSGPVEFAVAAGSIGIPADAPEALSVGATDAETDVLEAFSSRGPTNDGRIKPDLTAFSGVSTATFGPKAFSGTSAAAPHVAGAAGLLLSKTPYSALQIRAILESRALDLGTAGKDNLFGFGRLFLK